MMEVELKILAIVGSPHGAKGNTARLTRLVLDGAESEGAQVATVYLPGNTVLPCLGCDTCHKKGRCVQKDSFEEIQQQIREADGVVLGSPQLYLLRQCADKGLHGSLCGRDPLPGL